LDRGGKSGATPLSQGRGASSLDGGKDLLKKW
jgi:hypothetical protein